MDIIKLKKENIMIELVKPSVEMEPMILEVIVYAEV